MFLVQNKMFPKDVVGTFTITIALRTEILDAEFYSVGHSHCRNLAMPGLFR